ncbi:MAG: TIGR01906 family membrane protein [Firmicutes bacterium]|nr:TIGR01906 family membrane protein [Bacillota bacterium]
MTKGSYKKSKPAALAAGLVLGIAALLLATALSLAIIHIFDIPYVWDIGPLGIELDTGLSREAILENYNAAMDYLAPFGMGSDAFILPSLSWTEEGAIHFADCKVIFQNVYNLGFLSLALVLIAVLLGRAGKLPKGTLLVSGVVTLALPAAVFAAIAIDFDSAFVLFHEIFFSNDYWMFNPREDQILNILPAEFFLHCGIFIAAFWVLAAAFQFVLHRKTK